MEVTFFQKHNAQRSQEPMGNYVELGKEFRSIFHNESNSLHTVNAEIQIIICIENLS